MSEVPAIPPVGPDRRGRWFEDFQVGQVISTCGRTITEADISAFACLSGDFNSIHVDEAYASRTAFRGRIAHGLLVESIASGLGAQTNVFQGTIAALAEVRLKLLAPVRAGDTIHLEFEVVELDPAPSRRRGHVWLATRVYNQRGELVLDGQWDTLMLRDTTRDQTAAQDGP